MGCKIINEYRLRMRQSDVLRISLFLISLQQNNNIITTNACAIRRHVFFCQRFIKKNITISLTPIFDDKNRITHFYFVNRQNFFVFFQIIDFCKNGYPNLHHCPLYHDTSCKHPFLNVVQIKPICNDLVTILLFYMALINEKLCVY